MPPKIQVETVKDLLRERGYRWTAPREECLRVLAENELPLTAIQIYKKISRKDIDVVSVYRNVQIFAELGIICKVDQAHEGQRYRLSSSCRPNEHHHHLVCQNCGRAEDFEDCSIDTLVKKIFNLKGFRVLEHELRLTGACRSCSVAA